MNIAFSTLVIIMILSPGFIFKKSYSWGDGGFFDEYKPLSSYTAICVIISIFFNLIAVSIVEGLHLYKVEIDTILDILISSKTFKHGPIVSSYKQILIYFFVLYLSSWLLGKLLQKIVIKTGIDIKLPWLFKFEAPWYYILKRPKDGYGKEIKNPVIFIDVTVGIEGTSYLYRGVLQDFFFDKGGNLDRIFIEGVCRRNFPFSGKVSTGWVEFTSDRFLVKYKDITSMNVTYYKLQRDNNSQVEHDYVPQNDI
ncbi:MAG: hypothetical protein KKD44_10670 [Proteobacteria bacterium]|nr:hypothetical protein [Pseudomonadota bacterium]